MTNLALSPLEYFDTLRAEDETAWLGRAFVPPPGFETMRGMRSVIVFGEEGSGKTALRLRLIGSARETPGATSPLIVEWQAGVQEEAQGETFVANFLAEVFDLTAQSLARHLAHHPEVFTQALRSAQEAMVWLLRRYLKTDHEWFLLRLEEEVSPDGLDCLRQIFARTPRNILDPKAAHPRQMTEVILTLKAASFGGLWVIIDGLEAWLALESAVLGRMLTALFSALALLDVPGFAVKVMAPLSLRNLVSSSYGPSRRRFEIFELEWPSETLHLLCEHRLGLACDAERFDLKSLSADPDLLPWLEKYAGGTPRGWLEFLRPFLDVYLAQPERKPLSPGTTTDLRRRYPPRLHMDAGLQHVFLGYQLVSDLSESSLNLMRYLYTHPDRACNKEELYYRGLRNLGHQPRVHGDAGWEEPKTVEGVMDTALWRLRQSLEPDPKQPTYIVSERGKSIVRLENAW